MSWEYSCQLIDPAEIDSGAGGSRGERRESELLKQRRKECDYTEKGTFIPFLHFVFALQIWVFIVDSTRGIDERCFRLKDDMRFIVFYVSVSLQLKNGNQQKNEHTFPLLFLLRELAGCTDAS